MGKNSSNAQRTKSNKPQYPPIFQEKRRKRSVFNSNAGFTLIELLVVIVIIGILMSAIMMNSMIARDKARIGACKATMETVRKAMDLYMTDNGVYPDQSEINSYNDIINIMKSDINLTPEITCEEPFVYTSSNEQKTYRLETRVHYVGGSSGGGVKILLDNGAMREEPI
jgi:type II secretion system protein G